MVRDFAEARQIAERKLRALWRKEAGTFHVATWGWEDAEAFQVVVGAREWLVDDRTEYAEADAPVYLVEKRSGDITLTTFLVELERLEAMTPVGEGHPED